MEDDYIAPIVYLQVIGLLIIWLSIGVLIYRAWLRSWVREGRHPFFLRLLSSCFVIGGFLVSLFITPLPFYLTWRVDPVLNLPWILWTILVIWLLAFLIVIPKALRPYYE